MTNSGPWPRNRGGHISKSSGVGDTILQGKVRRKDGVVDSRGGGKTILSSRQVWTLLVQPGTAEDRSRWKWIVIKSSVAPQ